MTRPYRAPELPLGSTDYDFAIDIWAMGVIMAQLLAGCNLFGGSREGNQIYKICSVIGCPNSQTWLHGLALAASLNYNFPKEFRFVDATKRLSSLIPSVSAEAIDLIKLMLSWDPNSRPTARKALQHPFFIPCHITNNNPVPPPVLQSAYQSPIEKHSEVQEKNARPNNNGEYIPFNRS